VVWEKVINNGSQLLGLRTNAVFWILGIMTCIHLISGVVAGIISWTLGRRLQQRVGLSSEE